MTSIAKKLATIAMGAFLVLGATSPAVARLNYVTTYGSAGWTNDAESVAYADDIKKDGDPVYSKYSREASGEHYLHNKSGADAGAVASGTGSWIYFLKTCVSLDYEFDTCNS